MWNWICPFDVTMFIEWRDGSLALNEILHSRNGGKGRICVKATSTDMDFIIHRGGCWRWRAAVYVASSTDGRRVRSSGESSIDNRCALNDNTWSVSETKTSVGGSWTSYQCANEHQLKYVSTLPGLQNDGGRRPSWITNPLFVYFLFSLQGRNLMFNNINCNLYKA